MNTLSNVSTDQASTASARFSAPLGELKRARLEIREGFSNCELTGKPLSQDLFQAEFQGLIPNVRTRQERVIIQYPLSVFDWLKYAFNRHQHSGNVTLNTSIPWQIDMLGGVSHLDADLRELPLTSLTIMGGVSEAEIWLPQPSGTVQIHIASGVSHLRIYRPKNVAAQLKVGGGASHLVFDDQFYNSVGGGIRIAVPDYSSQNDRYDILVNGGVSNLSVRIQE